MSAELIAQAAADRERYEAGLAEGSADGATGERSPGRVHWRPAIGYAAAAAAGTVLLCALLPPLVVAAWWLPAVVLIVYRVRFPRTAMTPLFGARVGALVGVFTCAGAGALGTLALVVRRFGMHRMGGFDAAYADMLVAAEKQAVAQNGAGAAMSFGSLGAPEFRAGILLFFGLLASGAFVLLCVTCGAISAAAQRRRPTNNAE